MATEVLVDQVVTITVEFRDWNEEGTGDLVDMEIVEVGIAEAGATPNYDDPEIEAEEVVPGIYKYEWTPQEEGVFVVYFRGSTSGGDVTVIDEEFTVVGDLSETTSTLGDDYEVVFIGGVSPGYLDFEDILIYYPDADMSQVADLIYKFSSEAEFFLNGDEPDFLAIDYVRAATLCNLSRIFGDEGLLGDEILTLGDLTVSKKASSAAAVSILTRGNARTWCELAMLFRSELMRKHLGLKGVVRGGALRNPMPRRGLIKHHQTRWPSYGD